MLLSEGYYANTSGIFYVAAVQYVLLFGSFTWVVTPRILKALDSLHDQSVQGIYGQVPRQQRNCIWVFHPIEEDLSGAVIGPTGDYITLQYNIVAQYIVTHPI